MKLAHESILTELNASGKLPTPAGVALTILELARDPNSSTEDISMVLKGDPALSGQILKYANSAASGVREEVTTVNDALVRLGMKMVQQLCLGFSVLTNSRSGHCSKFDYSHYWAKSLARAIGAQVLSSTIPSVNAEEGFTCGLLVGIGGLGLASVYPEEYAEILDEWDRGTAAKLTSLETAELSIHRHDVTCALFADWRLPGYFGEAALLSDHGDWPAPPGEWDDVELRERLARLLQLANLAAEICLAAGTDQDRLVLRYLEIGRGLGVAEQDWMETFDLIAAEWERMGQVLEILTHHLPKMADLTQRATQSEKLGQLNEPNPDDAPKNAPAPRIDIEPEMAETGLSILVATDNAIEQKILLNKLAEAGHRPSLASDGQEALELALQTNPQVILANWMMPRIGGLELCRTMRQSSQTAGTYFIIMTSQDGRDPLVEAFEAGIDDYLVKPLSHDVMAARLKAASRIIGLQNQAARDREKLRKTVSELGKLSRELNRQALEDTLTGLPNRRAGLDRFDADWARASRDGSPLLCMLLDIDHFKKVNDTYGHDAGDVVLQDTARALKEATRDADAICRFGGEEFLLICPDADLNMAMTIGDRVRRAVEENHIRRDGFDGNVTVSVGVALRTGGQESPKDLIKEADLALYAAKENGRNKVCIYSD